MKVVADTNVLVSAFLWHGPPHRILAAAESGVIQLCTSAVLIDELAGVLARAIFRPRLRARDVTVDGLVAGYVEIVHLVEPISIPPVVLSDPKDDAVIACAVAAQASHIITGDPHLFTLKHYGSIHLVTPRTFIDHFMPNP